MKRPTAISTVGVVITEWEPATSAGRVYESVCKCRFALLCNVCSLSQGGNFVPRIYCGPINAGDLLKGRPDSRRGGEGRRREGIRAVTVLPFWRDRSLVLLRERDRSFWSFLVLFKIQINNIRQVFCTFSLLLQAPAGWLCGLSLNFSTFMTFTVQFHHLFPKYFKHTLQ